MVWVCAFFGSLEREGPTGLSGQLQDTIFGLVVIDPSEVQWSGSWFLWKKAPPWALSAVGGVRKASQPNISFRNTSVNAFCMLLTLSDSFKLVT